MGFFFDLHESWLMQLIWVSGPTAQVQTFSITARKVILSAGVLASALVALGFLFHWVGLRVAIEVDPTLAQSMGGVTTASEQLRLEAGYREKLDTLNAQLKSMLTHVQKLEADKNEIATLNKIESLRKRLTVDDGATMDGKGGPFKAISLDYFKRPTLGLSLRLASQDADHLAQTMDVLHQRWVQEIDWLKTLPTGLPIQDDARISSTFGVRLDPLTHRPSMHEGLDFVSPIGTAVIASAPGIVTRSEWSGAYGNLVEIAHAQGFHTRYAHLSQRKVSEGDKIGRGTEIGALGNTGRSTGPHLHYEIMYKDEPINPTQVLAVLRK
jgi:murein DD-endopeptidase MepM/ murein hydrolase activator NlpD